MFEKGKQWSVHSAVIVSPRTTLIASHFFKDLVLLEYRLITNEALTFRHVYLAVFPSPHVKVL